MQLYNALKMSGLQQAPERWLTLDRSHREQEAADLGVPLYADLGPRPLLKTEVDFKKDHYQLYCSAGLTYSELTHTCCSLGRASAT